MDAYAVRFKKVISKATMANLLSAQMQIMDFIAGLQTKLAIITNGSNPTDLDEAKKIAKNVESASLINKNILVATINPVTAEVKELKVQILKLKAKIREVKYISQEDQKQPQNNERNRKPSYKRPNYKPVNKKNLECYKYGKKDHFKSKYRSKSKDRTDYRNIWFLKTDQSEDKISNDSEMKEVNLNY